MKTLGKTGIKYERPSYRSPPVRAGKTPAKRIIRAKPLILPAQQPGQNLFGIVARRNPFFATLWPGRLEESHDEIHSRNRWPVRTIQPDFDYFDTPMPEVDIGEDGVPRYQPEVLPHPVRIPGQALEVEPRLINRGIVLRPMVVRGSQGVSEVPARVNVRMPQIPEVPNLNTPFKIDLSVRPEVKLRVVPDKGHKEGVRKRDYKGPSHKKYMAALYIINQTYGRADEYIEIVESIVWNAYVPGEKRPILSSYDREGILDNVNAHYQVLLGIANGDLVLDYRGVLGDLAYNFAMDRAIGVTSRLERSMYNAIGWQGVQMPSTGLLRWSMRA